MFENLLNPVFAPLLKLPPLLGVLIVSIIITVLVTLIYKWTTDQNLMKQLKDEIKEFQNEMKTLKDDPKKAMEVQKKAMQTNMKYMMQSFKPMLITFIPIVFIFGWLRGHYDALGEPVFFGLSWLWTYIIFSLVFSIGLRKFLKVH